MKIKKIFSMLLACVMIVSVLTACGASYESASGITSDGYYNKSESAMEAPMEPGAMYEESFTEIADMETDDSGDTESYLDSQKLIYTCDLRIETLTFNETVKSIKDLIAKYDGFIESDQLTDDSYDWYYSSYNKTRGTLSEYIVIRVPTQSYNAFLNDVEGSGKLINKSERVENITKSYNDTATTISVLEKERDMLLSMMDQCTEISEMITVESRLSEVQRSLALYNNQLHGMDMDIAFSTVTINVREVIEYTRTPVEDPTFPERVAEAISDSCESFMSVMADLTIVMIFLAPYLAIALVVLIIILITVKTKKRKEREKKVLRVPPEITEVKKTEIVKEEEEKK